MKANLFTIRALARTENREGLLVGCDAKKTGHRIKPKRHNHYWISMRGRLLCPTQTIPSTPLPA